MSRSGVLGAAVVFIGWVAAGGAHAADIKTGTRIDCIVGESQMLTDLGGDSVSEGRIDQIDTRFAKWIFDAKKGVESPEITLNWFPRRPGGAMLEIITLGVDRATMSLLSWTDDSLIAVTSASDHLTAEAWMYTVNFKQDSVIATRVQSNIAGVRGAVIAFSCTFEDVWP